MNKKRTTLIIILLIIIILSGLGIYFYKTHNLTGTISKRTSVPDSSRSAIDFYASDSEMLTFKITSNIEEGNVTLILRDSNQAVVHTLEPLLSDTEVAVALDKNDTYELAAECNNFVGAFKVKVYLSKNNFPTE